jgi:molybdopterin-guanine dinucleotide biosynthesis protein B
MQSDIPIVGLAGFANTGKTTFLEKLIRELKSRGYRVGVVKHSHHRLEMDQPGTDSWRHLQAGAEMVALAAPGGISLIKPCSDDPKPEQVLSLFRDVDLIIIEGYKNGHWPKIEVFQQGVTERPEISPTELLAVVSNVSPDQATPFLDANTVTAAADLLEMVIIGK